MVKTKIIQKIESSCEQILELCRDVPFTALTEPVLENGWSAKDVLAHLAAWVWRCAALIDAAYNTNGLLMAWPDVEGLNREFYHERKNWSWVRVETDFRQAHWALIEAIQHLPPERVNDALVQRTIANDTWEHYAQHRSDIENWRQQLDLKYAKIGPKNFKRKGMHFDG